MRKILFVCLGNICRSPAAEGVVRHKAPSLSLDSAGTGGWHVGEPPYDPMQRAAHARGYDLSDLRARQFAPSDFAAFDLIVVMDADNRADVEAQRPAGDTTPVRLFTEFGDTTERAVPDPYCTRDFDGCLDLIEACANGLVAELGLRP